MLLTHPHMTSFKVSILCCHLIFLNFRCALFLGEIDKPSQGILQRGKRKTVNVGICLEGVYVMDAKEKVACFSLCMGITPSLGIILISAALNVLQHVLLGLQFSELSWDHSYPEEEGDSHILWLEFDGEEDGTAVNKLLKIYSKQVRKMSSAGQYVVVDACLRSLASYLAVARVRWQMW